MNKSKLEISVDLGLFNGEYDFTEEIEKKIVEQITKALTEKATKSIEEKLQAVVDAERDKIQVKINEKIDGVIGDFLTKERIITDKWGNEQKRYTVEQMLQGTCDNYLEQKVDSSGKVTTDSYGSRKTRLEYFIDQAVDYKMKSSIDSAVSQIKNSVTKYLEDNIKSKLGEEIAKKLGIDKIKIGGV